MSFPKESSHSRHFKLLFINVKRFANKAWMDLKIDYASLNGLSYPCVIM